MTTFAHYANDIYMKCTDLDKYNKTSNPNTKDQVYFIYNEVFFALIRKFEAFSIHVADLFLYRPIKIANYIFN